MWHSCCGAFLHISWLGGTCHELSEKYSALDLCLSFRWSPTYDVSAILTSIQSLLSDPNPNSPANSMAAQLFKENRREYEKRVKACVEQSWCDD